MVALILLINIIAVTIINYLIGILQMRIFLYYKSQFSNFLKCKVDILICIYKLKRHLKRISTLNLEETGYFLSLSYLEISEIYLAMCFNS